MHRHSLRPTHHPDDVLKVTTPIIELLQTDPAPDDLLYTVAGHLIASRIQSDKGQAIATATKLLEAVRSSITTPGRLTFLHFYGVNESDPQCDIMLSDGTTSIQILAGLDEDDRPYLVSEQDRGRFAQELRNFCAA